mgnify:CR=1 FL=1
MWIESSQTLISPPPQHLLVDEPHMLLEHMLARYPVLWSGRDVDNAVDDDEWIASCWRA